MGLAATALPLGLQLAQGWSRAPLGPALLPDN